MTDISVVTFTAKLQNKKLTKNRGDADEASDRHPDATVGNFHAKSPVQPPCPPQQFNLQRLSEMAPLSSLCFE